MILFSILGFAAFVGILVLCIQLLYKLLASKDEAIAGEDARLLQSINAKLNHLEDRIEKLESIVTTGDAHKE